MIALLILLTGLALIWQSNNEKALAPIQARNYFGQFPFLKTLNPQESDFAAFNRAVADLKTHPGIGEIPFSSETNTFFPIWKARDFRIGQTFSQWSDWAQPVEASREGLNDLVEASLIFPSHSGVDAKGEFMARSGHFLGQRRAVQSLFAGVVYDLSQTNSLTAIEYQKALLRLSQMCSQDYIYVNQIVRCTILSVALSGLQNVLELPDLTEEQLKEFQSLLNQVSFWSEIQNSLKLENAWRLDELKRARASTKKTFKLFGKWGNKWNNSSFVENVTFQFWRLQTSFGDEKFYQSHSSKVQEKFSEMVRTKSWVKSRGEIRDLEVQKADQLKGKEFFSATA